MGDEPKIYTITVSKNYSKLLDIQIQESAEYFEKWFIITQEDDIETINVVNSANCSNIELVYYPLDPSKQKKEHAKSLLEKSESEFTIPPWIKPTDGKFNAIQQDKYDKVMSRGLIFDKGGAIRQVQKQLHEFNIENNDLVLLLDSDVVIPDNFLEKIRKAKIEKGVIYGCKRKDYLFHTDFLQKLNPIQYKTFDGAGYFQLYRYDSNRLCKRTVDCGYVDAEFRDQFDKWDYIDGLEVSHLGASDMNWEGKEIDSFIFDEELEEYGAIAKVDINLQNLTESRIKLKKFIEAKRLDKLQSKEGMPKTFLFPFKRCGLESLLNSFKSTSEISIGFKKHKEYINYFSSDHLFYENNHRNYMKNFPRLLGGNSNWLDLDEYITENFNVALDRLYVTYKKRLWPTLEPVKFLFLLRNPIDRAYSEYNQFVKHFPSSFSWEWTSMVSFNENIKTQIKNLNLDTDNNFVSNGCYYYYINKVIEKLELKPEQFLVITIEELTGPNSKKHRQLLKKFINVDNLSDLDKINVSNYDEEMKSNTKKMLKKFYLPHNQKLFKLIGRKIKEWQK